jgi:hypothetical protein
VAHSGRVDDGALQRPCDRTHPCPGSLTGGANSGSDR